MAEQETQTPQEEQFDAIFGGDAELQQDIASFEEMNPPPEEIADEQAELPKSDGAKAEKPDDTVPLRTFLEQKAETKELRRKIDELTSAMLAMQQPKAEPPKPAEPAGPPVFKPSVDINDDPVTYLREHGEYVEALARHQGKSAEEARAIAQHQQNEVRRQQGMQQFNRVVAEAEGQFRTQQPDYDDAVRHIWESHKAESLAMVESYGHEATPDVVAGIERSLIQTFEQVAANALRAGRNPAAAVYAMARARGYQGAVAADPAPRTGNVERLQRGLDASKSSQNVPGYGTPPENNESTGDWVKDLQRGAGIR